MSLLKSFLEYNSTWCFRTSYSNKCLEVLEFLIMEAGLKKENEDVKINMYRTYPLNQEMITYCETLFLAQEINHKLPLKAVIKKAKI